MLGFIRPTDILVISPGENRTGSRTNILMKALAEGRRVYSIETAVLGRTLIPNYYTERKFHEPTVVRPFLPLGAFDEKIEILKDLIHEEALSRLTIWTDCHEGLEIAKYIDHEFLIFDKASQVKHLSAQDENEVSAKADLILDENHSLESVLRSIENLNALYNEDIEHRSYLYAGNNLIMGEI